MTEEHQYPSEYGRGVNPALDEAWDILDTIKPGVIPVDVRAWLAGMITGLLIRERAKKSPLEETFQ
jgi:hypothetical protein